jgi:hypothetical protein
MINNWEQDIFPGDLVFYGGSGKSLGCFIFESSRLGNLEWDRKVYAKLISFSLQTDKWDPVLGRVQLAAPKVLRHVTNISHGKQLIRLEHFPPLIARSELVFAAYVDEQERLRRTNGTTA